MSRREKLSVVNSGPCTTQKTETQISFGLPYRNKLLSKRILNTLLPSPTLLLPLSSHTCQSHGAIPLARDLRRIQS